jgi:hypothetical protein
MKRLNRFHFETAAVLAAVATAAAPLAFGDDDYRFIVSGDPVAAATTGSSYGESTAASLDGVCRTFAESATTYLYTDKKGPTMLIVR